MNYTEPPEENTHTLSQIQKNISALETVALSFVNPTAPFFEAKSLADAADKNYSEFEKELSTNGFGCVKCGGYVRAATMKYYSFGPDVLCYRCQKLPHVNSIKASAL